MSTLPISTAHGPSTQAIHAGEQRSKPCHSLTDPIYCSATFTFQNTQEIIDYLENEVPREEYARLGNPSEKTVEAKLAELEGAEAGLLFCTGMAAMTSFLLAKLSAGDEVVFFDECYHHSREFCLEHLSRFGVKSTQIKTGDYEGMEAAITPNTRLLISEAPTNPHLSMIDVERFAEIGKRHGVDTLVDATLATPFNLRPLAFGVDYVLHSATKYLAGHNDLLAGVILGSQEKMAPIRKLRNVMGGVNAPHNIYLLQRGLKTFALRMKQHNATGQAVAEFLDAHPKVQRVYYPGLPSHPSYDLAKRYLNGYGGLLSFTLVDPDWRAAAKVIDSVRIPHIGPSLGGAESLIEQPYILSFYKNTPEERAAVGIPDNMVRLACGLEEAEDLIQDLEQALEQL